MDTLRARSWAAALCVASAALWGGWPLGPVLACIYATVLGAVALVGLGMLRNDRRAGGMLALIVVGAGTAFCVLSGIAMREASPGEEHVELAPVVTSDGAYLRHPVAGWWVGRPGPGWRRDDLGAHLTLDPMWGLVGTSHGSWGWTGDPAGSSMIEVSSFHLPAHPRNADGATALETAGDFLHGMVSGATDRDADVEDEIHDVPGERDFRTRAVGERAGRPVVAMARAILWDAPDGDFDGLAVFVSARPSDDDDWPAFLERMHAPGWSPEPPSSPSDAAE